jgi:hypothetical protein
MALVSVIQGGTLQDRYRALLLVRHPVGALRAIAETAGGLVGERLQLSPAAPEPLAGLLRERKLSAFLLEATELRPARNYRFHLTDGASTATRFDVSTLPWRLPAQGMTVGVGSCFFDGFDVSSRMEVVLQRPWLGQRPSLQFWNGDNLYLDVPSFGLLSAERPYVQTLERYLRYFDGTGYARARAVTPNYTTFDDHEFWNNFPEAQIQLSRDDDDDRLGYTSAAWACLDLFQSSLNPAPRPELFRPVQDRSRPGRSFQFDLPPLSVFFADLRSNRQRQRPEARMMARRDLQALVSWAASLRGPGVLVMSQPLWVQPGSKSDFNPPSFKAEYQAIWAALRSAPFDILLVSGDVHHSRLLRFSFDQAPNRFVYEFVSSPASHIPTVVTSVLPAAFFAQGHADVKPPDAVENSGQRLKANYYFGTSAQNTMGFLGFVPRPDDSVAVSATFVDYGGKNWPRAASGVACSLPLAARRFDTCDSQGTLFTLRRREPLRA